ncbi:MULTISPECIES: VOC family protein [unclassified Streptomyces]|uniref:VOC family protein n=1 Tax=unclassified Streptomyces TaxID=2593676 RepID=UPI00381AF92F
MAENVPKRAPVYAEGVPCWVDAQLPDVDAGKRFYGELFGWDFPGTGERPGGRAGGSGNAPEAPDGTSPANGPRNGPANGPANGRTGGPDAPDGLVPALLDGVPVAGLARKADGRMPTVWTVYFATPDADATARRILTAGGQLVTAPLPVGGAGTAALAADPEGAVFGLWQPAALPGFGVRHRPGAFAWAQLYARDTGAANTFYGHLFHDALFGPGAEPDFGRSPVADVFSAMMPPHFLVHFGTDDCAAALGTVSRLGGRVQAGPFAASYGTVAVVTDNQGASFALLQR